MVDLISRIITPPRTIAKGSGSDHSIQAISTRVIHTQNCEKYNVHQTLPIQYRTIGFRQDERRRSPALQRSLLQIQGGLGEIGGAAEVTPVVFVGAESEDFFALDGEAQIGVDD